MRAVLAITVVTRRTPRIRTGSLLLAAGGTTPVFPGAYRVATYYDGTDLRCHFEGANAPAADLVTTEIALDNTKVGIRMREVQ